MRIARFDDNLVGVVLDDGIHDVNSVPGELPPYRSPGHRRVSLRCDRAT